MNADSTRTDVVEPGGDQVAAHVGPYGIGSFADRLGLGHSISAAVPVRDERASLHDRGKAIVQMKLVLAGSGRAASASST